MHQAQHPGLRGFGGGLWAQSWPARSSTSPSHLPLQSPQFANGGFSWGLFHVWHRFILTCAGARYWAHPRGDSSHLSVRVRLVHSVMVGDRSCLVLVTAGCAPLQSSNACSDVLFTRRADGLRCLHVKALICVQVFRSICILTCRLLRNGFRLTRMCALAARISSPC